jgi:hypothetical protein
MTQTLDPTSPLGICIWDEDVPCKTVYLIDLNTSGYAHAPECTISDFCELPPIAPVPLPTSGWLLLFVVGLLFLWRKVNETSVDRV